MNKDGAGACSRKSVVITEASTAKGSEAEAVLCIGHSVNHFKSLLSRLTEFRHNLQRESLTLPRSRATTSLFHVVENTAKYDILTPIGQSDIRLQECYLYEEGSWPFRRKGVLKRQTREGRATMEEQEKSLARRSIKYSLCIVCFLLLLSFVMAYVTDDIGFRILLLITVLIPVFVFFAVLTWYRSYVAHEHGQ